MKKALLLSGLSILSLGAAMAQTGTFLIEANGTYRQDKITSNNYYSYQSTPVTIRDWDININAGYQLHKNIIAGINIGYGEKDYLNYYAGLYSSGQQNTATTFQLGAWGRYTYSINSWLFVYTQLGLTQYNVDVKDTKDFSYPPTAIPTEYYGTPTKGNGIQLALYPAVGFNIIKGYGINVSVGSIGYDHFKEKAGISENRYNFTLGQEFRLGLHKFIYSNKKDKKKPTE